MTRVERAEAACLCSHAPSRESAGEIRATAGRRLPRGVRIGTARGKRKKRSSGPVRVQWRNSRAIQLAPSPSSERKESRRKRHCRSPPCLRKTRLPARKESERKLASGTLLVAISGEERPSDRPNLHRHPPGGAGQRGQCGAASPVRGRSWARLGRAGRPNFAPHALRRASSWHSLVTIDCPHLPETELEQDA